MEGGREGVVSWLLGEVDAPEWGHVTSSVV